jgi:hypothetical protein
MNYISAFSVTLTIFRNREWLQAFQLFNADQTPMDLSTSDLALVVIPTVPGPSNGVPPVLSNNAPVVTGNMASFNFTDAQTDPLTAGKGYTWQFLQRQADDPNSNVMCAGPLVVQDSPPFPT